MQELHELHSETVPARPAAKNPPERVLTPAMVNH